MIPSRLPIPVSGISISRSLFFVPARIPQDSSGFLFFPEDFFHRNLLLAGVIKFRFSAMFTGIFTGSCKFLHLTRIRPEFLRIPPDSSGIPVPAKNWVAQLPQVFPPSLLVTQAIPINGAPTHFILISHLVHTYKRCFIYFICD